MLRKLLADFGMDCSPSQNGSWINLQCPFCGDKSQHLGYNLVEGFWSCFRCGAHREYETIAALLNQNITESRRTCDKYRIEKSGPICFGALERATGHPRGCTGVKLPYGTGKMTKRHREYLHGRHFDPDKLEAEWGLVGTGPIGPFSHRIIIPIEQDEKLVCYTSRDFTERAKAKYKTCPDTEASIPIKSCLYGLDRCESNSVVITEGPTKVWRLQKNTVCTFGATTSTTQIQKLSRFKKVYILFDEDDAGEKGADILAHALVILGVQTEIINIGIKDCAELSQKDADDLIRELSE